MNSFKFLSASRKLHKGAYKFTQPNTTDAKECLLNTVLMGLIKKHY